MSVDLDTYFDDADKSAFEHLPDYYDKESLADSIVSSRYGLDAENREIFENLPDDYDKYQLLERMDTLGDSDHDIDETESNDIDHSEIESSAAYLEYINSSSIPDDLTSQVDYDFDGEQADSQLDDPMPEYMDYSNYPDYPDYPDFPDDFDSYDYD